MTLCNIIRCLIRDAAQADANLKLKRRSPRGRCWRVLDPHQRIGRDLKSPKSGARRPRAREYPDQVRRHDLVHIKIQSTNPRGPFGAEKFVRLQSSRRLRDHVSVQRYEQLATLPNVVEIGSGRHRRLLGQRNHPLGALAERFLKHCHASLGLLPNNAGANDVRYQGVHRNLVFLRQRN